MNIHGTSLLREGLVLAAGVLLGLLLARPPEPPVQPPPAPALPAPQSEEVALLRSDLGDRDQQILLLRKELSDQDLRRKALEAAPAPAPRPLAPWEAELAAAIAAKHLGEADLQRLDACRKAYRGCDMTESIGKSRALLAWIAPGDPEAWVLYVLGREDRKQAVESKEGPAPPGAFLLEFFVPGQDTILVRFADGKVAEVDRAWNQPGEG